LTEALEKVTKDMHEEHIEHYKDGSVKGKGLIVDGQMEGYWEWFRKNGTKMRSGHFKAGKQVGEWITYDQQGQVYKVTRMK
jgi:antitoxin component YwqK of YwqJK toxin-antitoxin module